MISLVGYGFWSTEHEKRMAKETFMEECLTENKQYVCAAMWRVANSVRGTAYVPVIVPIK